MSSISDSDDESNILSLPKYLKYWINSIASPVCVLIADIEDLSDGYAVLAIVEYVFDIKSVPYKESCNDWYSRLKCAITYLADVVGWNGFPSLLKSFIKVKRSPKQCDPKVILVLLDFLYELHNQIKDITNSISSTHDQTLDSQYDDVPASTRTTIYDTGIPRNEIESDSSSIKSYFNQGNERYTDGKPIANEDIRYQPMVINNSIYHSDCYYDVDDTSPVAMEQDKHNNSAPKRSIDTLNQKKSLHHLNTAFELTSDLKMHIISWLISNHIDVSNSSHLHNTLHRSHSSNEELYTNDEDMYTLSDDWFNGLILSEVIATLIMKHDKDAIKVIECKNDKRPKLLLVNTVFPVKSQAQIFRNYDISLKSIQSKPAYQHLNLEVEDIVVNLDKSKEHDYELQWYLLQYIRGMITGQLAYIQTSRSLSAEKRAKLLNNTGIKIVFRSRTPPLIPTPTKASISPTRVLINKTSNIRSSNISPSKSPKSESLSSPTRSASPVFKVKDSIAARESSQGKSKVEFSNTKKKNHKKYDRKHIQFNSPISDEFPKEIDKPRSTPSKSRQRSLSMSSQSSTDSIRSNMSNELSVSRPSSTLLRRRSILTYDEYSDSLNTKKQQLAKQSNHQMLSNSLESIESTKDNSFSTAHLKDDVLKLQSKRRERLFQLGLLSKSRSMYLNKSKLLENVSSITPYSHIIKFSSQWYPPVENKSMTSMSLQAEVDLSMDDNNTSSNREASKRRKNHLINGIPSPTLPFLTDVQIIKVKQWLAELQLPLKDGEGGYVTPSKTIRSQLNNVRLNSSSSLDSPSNISPHPFMSHETRPQTFMSHETRPQTFMSHENDGRNVDKTTQPFMSHETRPQTFMPHENLTSQSNDKSQPHHHHNHIHNKDIIINSFKYPSLIPLQYDRLRNGTLFYELFHMYEPNICIQANLSSFIHFQPKTVSNAIENIQRVCWLWRLCRSPPISPVLLTQSQEIVKGNKQIIWGLLWEIKQSYIHPQQEDYSTNNAKQSQIIPLSNQYMKSVDSVTDDKGQYNQAESTFTLHHGSYRKLPYSPNNRRLLDISIQQWLFDTNLLQKYDPCFDYNSNISTNTILSLEACLRDGTLLCNLVSNVLEIPFAQKTWYREPKTFQQCVSNVHTAVNALRNCVQMSTRFLYTGIEEEIVRGHWDGILGLLEDMHMYYDKSLSNNTASDRNDFLPYLGLNNEFAQSTHNRQAMDFSSSSNDAENIEWGIPASQTAQIDVLLENDPPFLIPKGSNSDQLNFYEPNALNLNSVSSEKVEENVRRYPGIIADVDKGSELDIEGVNFVKGSQLNLNPNFQSASREYDEYDARYYIPYHQRSINSTDMNGESKVIFQDNIEDQNENRKESDESGIYSEGIDSLSPNNVEASLSPILRKLQVEPFPSIQSQSNAFNQVNKTVLDYDEKLTISTTSSPVSVTDSLDSCFQNNQQKNNYRSMSSESRKTAVSESISGKLIHQGYTSMLGESRLKKLQRIHIWLTSLGIYASNAHQSFVEKFKKKSSQNSHMKLDSQTPSHYNSPSRLSISSIQSQEKTNEGRSVHGLTPQSSSLTYNFTDGVKLCQLALKLFRITSIPGVVGVNTGQNTGTGLTAANKLYNIQKFIELITTVSKIKHKVKASSVDDLIHAISLGKRSGYKCVQFSNASTFASSTEEMLDQKKWSNSVDFIANINEMLVFDGVPLLLIELLDTLRKAYK